MKFINIEHTKEIKVDHKPTKKTISSLPKPVVYHPSSYKVLSRLTGKNVRMFLIDSGSPRHKDIKINGDSISFCNNNKSFVDKIGHATMLAGMIGANNKNSVVGFAPQAQINYAKVIDDEGNCNFNALVAATLWSIAKEADIIVIALGTQFDYSIFHDVIKKAHNENICVFSAAGNNINEKNDYIDFPSRYPQVFSVGSLRRQSKYNEKMKEKVDFALTYKEYYTTYLDNKYIKMSGSSISTAIVASHAALLVEKYKKSALKDSLPKTVYSDLLKIIK